MPTGYTYQLLEKSDMTMAEFAMVCARAFGALVMMRDDPMDAPIPDEFQPSDYHKKALERITKDRDEWRAMTQEQKESWQAAKVQELRDSAEESRQKYIKENEVMQAMIERVKAWTPPTPEHQGLKDFMVEQLTTSIHTHISDTTYWDREIEWIKNRDADIARDIAYHSEEYAKEVERCASRSKWVRELRSSLEATHA